MRIITTAAALAAAAVLTALAACGSPAASHAPPAAVVRSAGPLTDAGACKAIAAWMRVHGTYPPAAMRDGLANRVDPGGNPAAGDAAMANDLQSAPESLMSQDCYVLGQPALP